MMKIINATILTLLFILIISCNSVSTNADSVESVQIVDGQHKADVKQVLQTPQYTYLLVKENSTELWIACTKQDFSIGQTVYFMDGLAMENFESKELSRTFDLVYFLNEISFEPKFANKAESIVPPHGMIQSAVKKEIQIEKAEGGISLGELFANPESYKGKIVKIKGEVVKYNEAIMGKNWVHIQDGTGNEGLFDLAVTTADIVKVGDVVTFTGIINLNKDFGAGYIYEVIMEDAKLLSNI